MIRIAPGPRPFFVYGTLIPGQPNSHLWGDGIAKVEGAVFEGGSLYDMGFFPMLIEERGGLVRGVLIELVESAYKKTMALIDHLEGYVPNQPEISTYQRLERSVRLADGEMTKSWLYVGKKDLVIGRPEIPDGDWIAHSEGKTSDLSEWWLSIDTVFGHQNDLEN